MISKADFDRNLAVLSVLQKLNVFPMQVARFADNSGELPKKTRSNTGRLLVTWLVFSWAILHGLYVGIRLAQYLLAHGLVEEYEMVLNLNMAVASAFCLWWYWVCFLRHPEIVTATMRMLNATARKFT